MKRTQTKPAIENRRARYDYDIRQTYSVGIILTGIETRSIRERRADIKSSYVTIKNSELWLVNAKLTGTTNAPIPFDEQSRSRKLLAKRKEINEIIKNKEQGMTIVPIAIYNDRYIKLQIGVGVGKKSYDKRAIIKKREENRKIRRFHHGTHP